MGIGMVVILIFAILILKNLYRLSETVRDEAGHIAEDMDELRAMAYAKGFVSLADDGVKKILQGHTSFAEVTRVIDLTNRVH